VRLLDLHLNAACHVHTHARSLMQAVAAGSAPVTAAFAARIADIHCKQGQLAAAEQAAAAAEQQLASASSADAQAVESCRAAVQLVRAQLGIAAAGSKVSKAAWLECQAAVASCREAAGAAPGGWGHAMHAAALLTAAEAALQRDDRAAALGLAADALGATGTGSTACSSLRYYRAAALLFLGQHSMGDASSDQHLAVWGLGATSSSSSEAAADVVMEAPKSSRARKLAAKQPASRSRSKAAAAAAAEQDDGGTSTASSSGSAAVAAWQQQQHVRHLWHALELSRGLLSMHRQVWLLARWGACWLRCAGSCFEGSSVLCCFDEEAFGRCVRNELPLLPSFEQDGRCALGGRVWPARPLAPGGLAAALLHVRSHAAAIPAGVVQSQAAASAAAAAERSAK